MPNKSTAISLATEQITIATLGANGSWWRNVFTFPNLEQLTLHEPTLEQLQAVAELTALKRLPCVFASG